MKNRKEYIRCKTYVDGQLTSIKTERRVIYQGFNGAYIKTMGNEVSVRSDDKGLFYETKIKSIKKSFPEFPFQK